MADVLVGYLPQVTITGNSIYWPRGQYDPQFMSEATTSDYIQNQTRTNTKQIAANNGLQADGSWKMTVADSSGWSTNDRAMWSKNSSYTLYTTDSAAFTGASGGDRLLVCYSSTNEDKLIRSAASGASTTKAVSWIGCVPNIVWAAGFGVAHYLPNGDFTGLAQILIRNFTIKGGNNTYAFNFGDSSRAGGGIKFDRCRFVGVGSAIATTAVATGGVSVTNCMFIACYIATIITEGTGHSLYNNTMIDCQIGVDMYVAMNISNNVTLNCDVPYNTLKTVTGSNNGSDNSTAPGTSPVTLTRSSLKLMQEITGGMYEDARPQPTSSMYHAGVAVSGVTHDIDGNAWTNPPSIGCSNGPAFLEVIPSANNIKKDVVATNIYGTNTTGTIVAEQHTDDEVIDTAAVPGNYVVSNLSDGVVLDGVTYGLSGEGTYPNVDTLISKIDTLQESVDDIAIAGAAYLYAPTSATRNVGDNDGGDYTSLSAHDESYFSVGELAGASTTLGDRLTATVTRATSNVSQIPSLLRITGRYQGTSGHSITVQVYNYASAAWENHATMLSRTTDFDYVIPLGLDNHNATTGEMKVRFLHSVATGIAAHALYIDWISWEKVATTDSLGSDVARIYDLLVDVDNEVDSIDTNVEAVKAKTDNLPASPANEETLDGIVANTLLAQIGDGTLTVAEALRIAVAAAVGKTSGFPSAPVFRNASDTQDVISGTLDANGNRTSVTVTP